MTVTAVIVAGGQGRRMGGVNKALLPLGAESVLVRQIRAVSGFASETIVVANGNEVAAHLGSATPDHVRVVPDHYAGEGPLAGLHAGFQAASHPFVWLLGCDQPYPSAAAARLLLGRLTGGPFEAALPVVGGRLQPLHAVYRKETSDVAETLLRSGNRRLFALLDSIAWTSVDEETFLEHGIDPGFADDMDTPEQYENVKRRLESQM